MGDWQTRLANALTQGDTQALPEVLVLLGALIGCSSFALVQFFTMLGTRWGDKNPASKSFVLSILVHVVVILAWSTAIAIHPLPAVMSIPNNTSVNIPIHEVVEQDDIDNFDPNEIPIWKQLETPPPEVTRQDRPAETPEEMKDSPRMEVDAPTPDANPADLANLSVQEQPEISPTQQVPETQATTQPAPVSLDSVIEPSQIESREDAGAGSVVQRMQRTNNPEVDSDELPKTRGTEELTAVTRPDDQGLSIPVNAAEEPDETPLLSGISADTIRKGTAAPSPSNAPDDDFQPEGRTDQNGKASFSRSRGIAREKNRIPTEGMENDTLPNRLPNKTRDIASLEKRDQLLNPSLSPNDELPSEQPTPTLSKGGGPNLPNRSPATYKLRQLEKRRGTALKNGGSLESEKAVENSLQWLAKVQEPAGFWDADRFGGGAVEKDPEGHIRTGDGQASDSGVTGLALLAFIGAGYTTKDGDYADNVERALQWLIRQQREDGYLGGEAKSYDQMYCHAIASFALGEACGMLDEAERPPELRRAVRLAVHFIVERQCTDGGWRYKKEENGDMSMFGWQLMALKSADIAGVKVQPDVWTKMIGFLKKRSQGNQNGLAGYNLSTPNPTPAMTAEALFCKQMIGISRSNPACQEAVAYLMKNLPRITKYDEYYWYYGTLSMFQHGGQAWTDWNDAQRDLLIHLQETRGPDAGSWAPRGKWAGIGGRIYSTAISTLCLEVYYRYLPLYQSSQE